MLKKKRDSHMKSMLKKAMVKKLEGELEVMQISGRIWAGLAM